MSTFDYATKLIILSSLFFPFRLVSYQDIFVKKKKFLKYFHQISEMQLKVKSVIQGALQSYNQLASKCYSETGDLYEYQITEDKWFIHEFINHSVNL